MNCKHSRTCHSLKEQLAIHTAPVFARKHDTEGKRHLLPLQTLLRRRQLIRKVGISLSL